MGHIDTYGDKMDAEIKEMGTKAKTYSAKLDKVMAECKKVIVGQDEILRKTMIAMMSDGHALLEGAPGLAKTLMIKTLSETLGLSFRRIQFTPDLLPADIIGTKIYDHKTGSFRTEKGPIFSNMILADEINRAPPKVQSALLEAMQEGQATIHGDTFPLQRPFLVLATQNPIETEGTYRLPEAQVDRFMFKLSVGYPKKDDERSIIRRNTGSVEPKAERIMDSREITEIQKFCRRIYADEKIEEYIVDIVDATRRPEDHNLDLKGMIEYGASPRASIWMAIGAKACALLEGRGYVIPEDVRDVAREVLRHRIVPTYEAEADGISSDDIIAQILDKVKAP